MCMSSPSMPPPPPPPAPPPPPPTPRATKVVTKVESESGRAKRRGTKKLTVKRRPTLTLEGGQTGLQMTS
jgi:hypothetical protein